MFRFVDSMVMVSYLRMSLYLINAVLLPVQGKNENSYFQACLENFVPGLIGFYFYF